MDWGGGGEIANDAKFTFNQKYFLKRSIISTTFFFHYYFENYWHFSMARIVQTIFYGFMEKLKGKNIHG